MSDHDGRIDRQLRATGDRWRAGLKSSEMHVDPALFTSSPTPGPTARGFFASLAGATAIVAVVLLLAIVMPPVDPSGDLPTDQTSPAAVSPTDTADPSHSPAISPSSTIPPEADGVIHLPTDQVKSISLEEIEPGFQTYGYASFGSKVVFVQEGHDTQLFLADVNYARVRVLVEAPEHDRILAADVSNDHVVWLEGHYATTTGAAPCGSQGELTWRLMAYDMNTGESRELTSGVHSRIEFCTAVAPSFAIDGELLAYALEKPRADYPLAWQVTLVSITTGQVARTFETDLDLFELGLAGTSVAYLEGNYDEDVEPFAQTDTRLMLSTAGDPEPIQLASDADDMSFSGDRLAWVDDQEKSRHDEGASRARFMTATLSDLTPREVSVRTGLPPRRPVAGGDIVTWPELDQVILWDPASGVAWPLEPTPGADRTNSEGGWLTWLSLDPEDASEALNGIPLAGVPLSRTTAEPTPTGTMPPVVNDGDAVVATGVIIAWDEQGPKLCTEAPSLLMDDIVRCSPINVDVEVGTLEGLPGWTPQEGGGYSSWLTVHGQWIDGVLHIDSAVGTERPGFVFPLSPCGAPAGGWPGDLPNTMEGESLSRHLGEVVDSEPFLFSGMTSARLTASDDTPRVIVVATVGDLQEVRDRLSAIYPHNLCVIQVEYSAAELAAVGERLFHPEDGTWQTNIDVIAGRVVLKVAVLDEEALDVIGDDIDKVIVQPLIARDTAR